MPATSRTAAVLDALGQPPTVEQTAEGTRVTLRLPVDPSIPQLAGHYPGFPILPGVLLIDCLRQAAGAAWGAELRLCGIDRARFVNPLLPGDELELSLLVSAGADGRVEARGRGLRADGQLAAELSATLEPVAAHA
jgi:3-hydroxyacyl-[acyl-carrier-protein] dehydratase